MPVFSPEQLAKWTRGTWTGSAPAPVSGFCQDSRALRAGEAFVCLRTDKRDGHDFLTAARKAGAAAALTGRKVAGEELPQLVTPDPLEALGMIARRHRETFAGPVIGVTGSCGKTSTKDLLALLLGGAESVLATSGNFNNLIGVPLTLTRLEPTRHRAAVIEAGINEPGEMAKLAAIIRPDHAVVTLVAAAHLEKLGSLENVAAEKALLPAAVPEGGWMALPVSCFRHRPFRELKARLLTVAAPESDREEIPPGTVVVHYRVESASGESRITLDSPDGGEETHAFRHLSRGMAANAALALALARRLGVGEEDVRARAEAWSPARFRGETRRVGPTRYFVDCYNANPAAMADSLEFFRESASPAPRVYVIGCMGELGAESERAHREIGRRLRLRPEDRACLTGVDVPALRAGLLEAGNRPEQIMEFHRIAEVAPLVEGHEGDVFLKGSRVYELETLVEPSQGKEAAC